MVRKILSLLLSGMMVASLTACASSGNTAAPSSGGSAGGTAAVVDSTETAAPADSGGGAEEVTTITWTQWESGNAVNTFETMIAAFEAENPDIKINFLNMPEEYDTKLTAMIASNQVPDIAMLESASMLYPLAEEGKLANILELVENDSEFNLDNLLPTLRYMQDENTMVGYGIGAEDMVMFYNPKLFTEAGVPEPPAKYADAWDWQTFIDYCKLLTVDDNGNNAASPDFDPTAISQYAVTMGQWWAQWGGFVASNGGDYLSADGKSLGLLEPAGLEALQNIVDLIHVYHVMPTPESGQALPGLTERIVTGKVAMDISGQWSNLGLMDDEVEYKVAALPKMGDQARTMCVAGCISIFQNENVDKTWRFFKYMYSENDEMTMEKSGLWLPVIGYLYEDEWMDKWITDRHPENYRESVALPIVDGTSVPTYTGRVVNFSKINDIVGPALDLAWSGEKSVKEALEDVLPQIEPLIAGSRYTLD